MPAAGCGASIRGWGGPEVAQQESRQLSRRSRALMSARRTGPSDAVWTICWQRWHDLVPPILLVAMAASVAFHASAAAGTRRAELLRAAGRVAHLLAARQ